eukprot:GHVS01014842.1.p1 GENE.GHVS01014842.1~~GHVS01014842.1.p1  ORF type:complete len:626 (+),score=84.50 GHVS01014842.1:245-1879(+)
MGEAKCADQEEAISDLFLACLASAFSFSLVAGTLLDYIGPKATGVLGQLIGACAWLMLSFASENNNTYLAGFVFVGLGSDTGFLPSLPIANLFPGNEGLVVALLGAAKSISFAVAIFMEMGAKQTPSLTWQQVCLWYMGCGPLLCACIAAFLFPLKSYLPWNEFAAGMDETELPGVLTHLDHCAPPPQSFSMNSFAIQARRPSMVSVHSTTTRRRSVADSVVSRNSSYKCFPTEAGGGGGGGDCKAEGGGSGGGLNSEFVDISLTKQPTGGGGGEGAANESDGKMLTSVSAIANETKAIVVSDELDEYGLHSDDTKPVHSPTDSGGVITSSFRSQYLSMFNMGITVYAIFRAVMYAFFTTSMEHLVGINAKELAGIISPLSFLPCLVVGKMVDWWGIMVVMFVLNGCITIAYGFSMVNMAGVEAFGYMAVILYTSYVSFYSSQLYCYVSDTFESRHFGKFVGITSMVAGLCGLLKKPLGQLARGAFHDNYYYPCIIMLGFCAINFAILVYLYIKKRRNPHPFWPKKKPTAKLMSSDTSAEVKAC